MVSLPDFSRQFQTHESSRQLWLNSVDYRVHQKDRNVRKGFAERRIADRGGRKEEKKEVKTTSTHYMHVWTCQRTDLMTITIEKRRGKYMQRKKTLHKTRRNVISTKIKQQTATKIEMLSSLLYIL